jgi:glutaconyl-CoA/methylmalonyl-CoA decarboxylase subunit gamma
VRFKLQADGQEYEVSVTPDGTVSIDGEVFQSKLSAASSDRRVIQVGDSTFEVRVAEAYGEVGCYTLELAGERVPVTASHVVREGRAGAVPQAGPSPGRGADGPAGAGPGGDVKEGVWAPMPGKIANVLVGPGDLVEEGQAVVVLEAMKMENELRAPKKAKVTAVLVKKGDQAEKGQLLVALE